ncbi:hypothetical protein HAX54_010630, partial [Datura stramonium]|nr:hypothetical protein [Datura stramonium]
EELNIQGVKTQDTVYQSKSGKEMHHEAESSDTGSTSKKKEEVDKGESKAIIVWKPELKRSTEVREQMPGQHIENCIESLEEQELT